MHFWDSLMHISQLILCFSNPNGISLRAISRAGNVKKHSFGYFAPPVGQFTYYTKLLFLFPIAASLASVGGSVGQFVYAPLATFLMDTYGWKITVFVLAGQGLACVILGK